MTEPDLLKTCRINHKERPLWKSTDKLLVAVSGGVDSVVLLDIMNRLCDHIAVAHCNFSLRGAESDRDEEFTRQLAEKMDLPIYVKVFNTYEEAYNKGVSVEMAARELRYDWFNELLQQHEFRYVATGHHADDQIETLFLNLIRGTGISGLRGMLPVSGNIIRPLLPFFRNEITEYARLMDLSWVEDSTNRSVEIRRNKIRHKIIPAAETINPGFRESALRTISNIREAEIVYRRHVSDTLSLITVREGDLVKVSIAELAKLTPRSLYLFELLSEYGFNGASIEAVDRALEGIPGKQFFSATHRIVKDREYLLISKLSGKPHEIDDWQYLINEDDALLEEPFELRLERLPAKGFEVPQSSSVAALDLQKLKYPLTLRRWQHGDYFFPLGMRNRKKLSDFFSDLKFSMLEKEKTWVLLSGNDIAWVVGHRIDNRFRITSKTKMVCRLSLLK